MGTPFFYSNIPSFGFTEEDGMQLLPMWTDNVITFVCLVATGFQFAGTASWVHMEML